MQEDEHKGKNRLMHDEKFYSGMGEYRHIQLEKGQLTQVDGKKYLIEKL